MCHSSLSAHVDFGDLDLGEVLAVTALAMRVLPALLLEGDDLGMTSLLDDLTHDRGAVDERRAGLGAVATQHQDFAEGDRAAGVADQLLDLDDVVLDHFVLLAAGADDREHIVKSLNSLGQKINSRGRRICRKPRNILTGALGSSAVMALHPAPADFGVKG